MFENKNQEHVDEIKTEIEGIKNDILGVFDNNSVLGTGINSLLDDIDRRILKAESHLESIGMGWASKNNQLREIKGMANEIRILFARLLKDVLKKIENAELKGKKYQVPSKKVRNLRDHWVAFAVKLKEKIKQAEARKERRNRFLDIRLPLDVDTKEDAIVNEQSKEARDREAVVVLVAKEFGVEPSDIRNWPDHMLLSSAERIMRGMGAKKGSGNPSGPNGQGPSFE